MRASINTTLGARVHSTLCRWTPHQQCASRCIKGGLVRFVRIVRFVSLWLHTSVVFRNDFCPLQVIYFADVKTIISLFGAKFDPFLATRQVIYFTNVTRFIVEEAAEHVLPFKEQIIALIEGGMCREERPKVFQKCTQKSTNQIYFHQIS